jgi:hypothetical protein
MFKVWATHHSKTTPDLMLGQASFAIEHLHDGDKKTEDLRLRKEVKKYKKIVRQIKNNRAFSP